jgi:hypothetical protein
MENIPSGQKPDPKQAKQKIIGYALFEAGIEFALLIGIPLFVLVYAGKWLDNKLRTHFIVIIGILLAITISSFAVYKRIKDYEKLIK